MEGMTQVDITSVAQWFYEVNEQEEYSWVEDFPCLLSPWPVAIYKWRHPRTMNSEGQIIKSRLAGIEHETLVTRKAIQNDDVIDGRIFDDFISLLSILSNDKFKRPPNDGRDQLIDWIIANDIECRWMQLCFFVFSRQNNGLGFISMVLLDKDGRFVGTDEIGIMTFCGKLIHKLGLPILVSLYPLAFALSLLNCRNVEVRDRPISRQQRRLAERKGQPVTVYKELVVDAFRRQVRSEVATGGGSEVKRAMHICRGHFVTYTEDNPLFGKYVGTFWKDMHVRGRQSAGRVHKTYSVNGPQDLNA